jgi:hypothetical protein
MSMLPAFLALMTVLSGDAQAPIREIAPGIPIPATGTVWVLDISNGKSTLSAVEKHAVTIDKHRGGSNLLAGLTRGRGSVDIASPHSSLTVKDKTPVFLARAFAKDNAGHDTMSAKPESFYQLIRLQARGKKREVHMLDYGAGSKAKVVRYDDVMATTATRIEGTPWLKIIPNVPLPTGEYAIEVKMADPHQYSSAIWDFSIGATGRTAPK